MYGVSVKISLRFKVGAACDRLLNMGSSQVIGISRIRNWGARMTGSQMKL
jgi:hypothetical protein